VLKTAHISRHSITVVWFQDFKKKPDTTGLCPAFPFPEYIQLSNIALSPEVYTVAEGDPTWKIGGKPELFAENFSKQLQAA
jgi:hypothetical protein